MNNKLFARILTAVICICMMATVAFAADPTLSVEEDTATLSFVVEGTDITVSEEDQITMLAYLVDAAVETPANIPDYTNQAVVAINQVDGSAGFGDVLIAASKLEEGKKIAVVLGGSDGTTEKYLVAQEVINNEVVVTVMNGATAINITAVDGNVTLPADTAWNGGASAYTLTLYSWVTADGKTEYLAGATVAAADLEGVTLYAKYTTGIMKGDVDGNKRINAQDYGKIRAYIGSNKVTNKAVLETLLVAGGTMLGDVDGNGRINAQDYGKIRAYIGSNKVTNKDTLESIHTVINK